MSGLPEGWALTTLQEVAIWSSGGTPSRATPSYFSGSIPWFKTGELGNKILNHSEESISEAALRFSSAKLFPKGSVAIAMYGATIGKTSILGIDASTNQACAVGFPEAVSSEFLYYFLLSQEKLFVDSAKGGAQPNISQGIIKAWPILLPPTAEQTRIVEKLEELLSDLDAGVAELKAAQKKLVQYRQSLLKAAVEGKLTQHWREQRSVPSPSPQPLSHQGRGAYGVDAVNDAAANYQPHFSEQKNPNLKNAPPSKTLPSPLVGEGQGERGQLQPTPPETGAQLLARILKQRRTNWEAKQLAKFQQQGKTPPKGWQDKYPEPVKPDTSDLPELPEGWVWASVEQIASDERYSLSIGPFGSNLKVPDYREAGVPLVFVRNIRSGNYGGAYTKYVSLEKAGKLNAHSVSSGDVLITKMGEPPGDADVYPDNQPPAIITADCIKVRCWGGLMRPEFLKTVINSYIGQRQIEPMTQGVAQKKVSLGRFTNLAVPIPSIQEQDRIMEMVSVAIAEAVAQEAAIEISLKQSAAQRKNILKAAFSGQLVPQDPNDEPASVLLERIRAERATRQTAKAPKKRTTKTAL